MKRALVAVSLLLMLLPARADEGSAALFDAAREGDLASVKRLIEAGVDVNASTRYGATALSYAADKGHAEIVGYLIEKGADLNNEDTFYKVTPIGWALVNDHDAIVVMLLEAGAEGADDVLSMGVQRNKPELVKLALQSDQIDSSHVAQALTIAARVPDSAPLVEMLQKAEVRQAEIAEVEVPVEVLERYAGHYKSDQIALEIDIRVEEGKLVGQGTGQPSFNLVPTAENEFKAIEVPNLTLSFNGRGGIVEQMTIIQGGATMQFKPVSKDAVAEAEPEPEPEPEPEVAEAEPIVRGPAQNWPSFRGPSASGVADGQGAPTSWDVAAGTNIRFKTPIPGLGNSSPIVWGDQIFVSTAVSAAGDDTFRVGLYGDVDTVDDESEHAFKLYALSKKDGKILWERTVASEVPGAKRHLKSTQANSTPVTDGKRIVTLFGTIGVLVAHDLKGKELWRTDVGVLDAGWFYDETYQWGHASSPVIYDDRVIVQADIYEGSFIAAYSLKNGKELWKTSRDEVPTWGTPTIYRGKERDELITNGTTVRGYDPKSGKELWTLGPNSEVTVATPIIHDDTFYVTAGYPPVRPIYAIRAGSKGDLTLAEETFESEAIAWSKNRGGTYMPTPIVYRGKLHTCANNGRLTVYDAADGELIYKARIAGGGSFTGSPVAADGHLYFTEENGGITVVRAGDAYEEVGTYEMDEIVMTTPAISDGLLVVRTLGHVVGIGEPVSE